MVDRIRGLPEQVMGLEETMESIRVEDVEDEASVLNKSAKTKILSIFRNSHRSKESCVNFTETQSLS